jgi:hypothetical protein
MKTTQLAAQLYTCRDLLQTPPDIAKTLRRVRAAGYTAVQVSAMGPIPGEELKRILDGGRPSTGMRTSGNSTKTPRAPQGRQEIRTP